MTCEGCSGAVSRILNKLGGEDEAASLFRSSHARARVRACADVRGNNPTFSLFYCRFVLVGCARPLHWHPQIYAHFLNFLSKL